MNLKSLTLNIRSGGLSTGLFAPHLELVGEGGVELGGLEVAEVVLALLTAEGIKVPDVYLSGDLTAPANEDTSELLGALIARGRQPVVEVSGYEIPRWLALCPIRIALVTEEPWLAFPAQEIRYKATVLHDPNIDPKLHRASSFVLDPQRNLSAKQVVDFLATSAFIWRLVAQPSWNIKPIDYTKRLLQRSKQP